MNISSSLIIMMLALFMTGCSDKTPKTEVEQNLDHIEESIDETADDIEQEACETVKGDIECAAERAQEEVEEAAEDL